MLNVTRVLAPNPSVYTLEGTNTWVIGSPMRGPSVVIDPGPDVPGHLREVARTAGTVEAVLLTHDHPDHAPGAAAFAAMTDAELHAFRYPGATHLHDGQRFSIGTLTLVAIHTPGHTSDHVAFHVASDGALFTGDAVLGRGTSFIDPPSGDLAQYMRSLARMLELRPRTIYPGHGPIVTDAEGKLRGYLDHRAERERQVLDALSEVEGGRTIPDMVSTIYADQPAEVHALATRSVLAHLLKLEGEGLVARRGRGDATRWSTSEPRSCERCGKLVRGRGRYCSACSLVLLQEGTSAEPGHDA
jgi:glyoxylase-like metal-dependent hydrolase (beta-lactamase superfamily II)